MEFTDIIVKENPGVCRCCLSEGCYKDLSTEYIWMGDSEIYADMLMECFDISISQHSDGPNGSSRLICEVCITRLRDACNFKKQVFDSEQRFVDMLSRGEFRPNVLTYELPMKEELQVEMTAVNDDEDLVEYFEDEMDFLGDVPDETNKNKQEDGSSALRKELLRGQKVIASKAQKKKATKKGGVKEGKIAKEKTGAKIRTPDDVHKKTELARKLLIKRRNVEYVLQYSNVTPFMWYKGRFRCFYCTEPMKDALTLREHTANSHQSANLELVVHDRTKHNRNRDAAVKIDVTDLMCKLCYSTMNNIEELIHHLIIAHDAEYDMSVQNCLLPFKLDKDNPTCASCGQKFLFFVYLLKHANKHHLMHNYMCDICGTSFQGENHLKMHNRYYHREGGYNCEYCHIGFTTLSKKVQHEKNVHLVNLSTCPHCPTTFKSPYMKKRHLANVHGVEELKIRCPYCDKVYPQESIMSRHMRRVHLREKNVECEVCGEKFFGPYDVKLHMVRHNGEKKFVCYVCGKRFSKKSNLNSHAIVHTGEKKFVCPICSKAFAHHANLKSHVKSNHPDYQILEQDPEIENLIESEIVKMEFITNEELNVTQQYIVQ